jgi:RND family efflux transporter MFP subunit
MSKMTTALLLCLLPAAGTALADGPPFDVFRVEQRVLPKEAAFEAILEAVNQSTVAAQAGGRIVELSFDVNDLVPKGSVLLRIDETTQRAQLDAAQAELLEAQARSSEAQAEFARIKEVHAKDLVSRSELDRASANLKAAQARLDATQARLKQAEEQLEYTVVRAPYAGIVTKRHVEIGETVAVGQPLMTGFSLQQMRAAASVPQSLLDGVRKQGKARVILTALGDRELPATRLTFFPFADPVSHTFTVRAELPPDQDGIYPGMFAKVLFEVGTEERVLVPAEAVVYRSEVTAVYVMGADGRVALRQVRAGRLREGNMMEVLAGLEAGEQVALDPVRAAIYLKQQRAEVES